MSFPLFEAIMIISFGIAWPFSIIRSYRSKTNKGKSLLFIVIIGIGYVSGIIHKLFWSYDLVIILYVINFIMVSIDIFLYIRNMRFEKITQS